MSVDESAKRIEIRQGIADVIAPLFIQTLPYRPHYVDPFQLPGAFVYIETGVPEINHSDDYAYDAIITIEIMVQGVDVDLEAQLDQHEKNINTLLDEDQTIGGIIDGIVRADFQYDRDPETAVTSLSLTYQISYED